MPILSSLGAGSARSYGLVKSRTLLASIIFTTANVSSVFTTTTTWSPPAGVTSAEYLLVAGGGAGGGPSSAGSGGGGAGGYLTSPNLSINPSATYTFTIGGGGTTNSGAPSSHGSNSTLTSPAPGFSTITAYGGGRGGEGGDEAGIDSAAGGMPYGPTPAPSPSQFGSGGGAGRGGYPLSFGVPGQGNYGGDGQNLPYLGGGGGGAGTGGGNSPGSPKSRGQGGDGLNNPISGTPVGYAGGGGGNGGSGATAFGGGDPSTAGTTNRGGGGGAYANGGSGIGIIRYAVPVVISDTPPITGYTAWYTADSWTGSQWTDLSGNGYHATTIRGTITKASSVTGNGASSTFNTLRGGTGDGLRFPSGILPSTYTLFHVTRTTGGTRARIVTGSNNNWLSGHWNGGSGIAYHEGWLTDQGDRHGNKWFYSCDQNSLYRSNGVTRGTGGGASTALSINYGTYAEYSDWECAEVLVYPSTLSSTDYQTIEQWLAYKYLIY